MMDWGDLIMMQLTARLRAWISRRRLDRLTAPIEEDPRAALRAEFDSPSVRAQLARFGAELVRVNIGHIDTPTQVDSQRLENWESFWKSQDKVTLAQGEALQVAYEALGRAEGQADMLKTIAKALEAISPSEAETSQLILLRISQMLETIAASTRPTEAKTQSPSQPAES